MEPLRLLDGESSLIRGVVFERITCAFSRGIRPPTLLRAGGDVPWQGTKKESRGSRNESEVLLDQAVTFSYIADDRRNIRWDHGACIARSGSAGSTRQRLKYLLPRPKQLKDIVMDSSRRPGRFYDRRKDRREQCLQYRLHHPPFRLTTKEAMLGSRCANSPALQVRSNHEYSLRCLWKTSTHQPCRTELAIQRALMPRRSWRKEETLSSEPQREVHIDARWPRMAARRGPMRALTSLRAGAASTGAVIGCAIGVVTGCAIGAVIGCVTDALIGAATGAATGVVTVVAIGAAISVCTGYASDGQPLATGVVRIPHGEQMSPAILSPCCFREATYAETKF